MLVSRNINKVCSRGVLDQVVATRDETARNVRGVESVFPRNNSFSSIYVFATSFSNEDVAPPPLMCHIAVNGEKGNISLTTITVDATAIISSRIVGDSAVSEDERSCIIIDATAALAARSTTKCAIARDSAVG